MKTGSDDPKSFFPLKANAEEVGSLKQKMILDSGAILHMTNDVAAL